MSEASESRHNARLERRGAIRWFAGNPVAANLLMLVFILGGTLMTCSIRQEVFPDFRLDVIRIAVPYPGASPAEIEEGILLPIEEKVRGLDGVDKVTSAAMEDGGSVYVSLELNADQISVLSDVKNEVDRLTVLPQDAERPTVALVANRFEVVSLVLYGPQDQALLRQVAEDVRDELLRDPNITNAELVGAPPREIQIEVPQSQLRTHGLTLETIAQRIAGTALDLPGGAVKTSAGEVRLRTSERRHSAEEFAEIPVVTSSTGTEVELGQVASSIQETFEDSDQSSLYNGQPAIMIKVFRTGEQTPIEVSAIVHEHVDRLRPEMPAGVAIDTWFDWSEIYRQRIELLIRNAAIGLVLVLLILGLFLELRLAFWVTMGIPVSFLGAILLMPAMNVSVNMISLFAFIVTLGMVVDDAIVVGENIFEMRQRGVKPIAAAVSGAREVAMPVCFAIATSIVAFAPMLFVPGFSGKLYRVIPTIVISVLIISLIESLWVLPAHLAALKEPRRTGIYAAVYRRQQRVKRLLESFIHRAFAPALAACLRRRYLAISVGIATLLGFGGLLAGGHIGFRFMPDIASDLATGSIHMPYGTPVAETQALRDRMLSAAQEVIDESGEEGIVRGIFSEVGTPLPGDPGTVSTAIGGAHLAHVHVFFVESGERQLSTSVFLQRWREKIGTVPQAEKIRFESNIGPSPGPPISVELHHDDMDVLDAASADLALAMQEFAGVWDIDRGFSLGKPQLDLSATQQATSLGITPLELARQVRSSFQGAEALRQQEGRNEVKVLVRLPARERQEVNDVESLLVRTPTGGEVPLLEAAEIRSGRSWPVIQRSDGHRIVEVTAELTDEVANPATVLTGLEEGPLAELKKKYPGLRYEFGGSQREQAKAMGSLLKGAVLAAIAIFALLAIPFRSYIQPAIVMAAIPFGVVGALIGHLVMGFEMSMISVMGLVALAGVVVNDSLVLIDAANIYRREGKSPSEAIHAAGVRRFRPILLTSLTTFFGLTPMILETSVQAQFLVPMAISLGFGVLFATFIILLLVPAFYMIVDDVTRWASRSADGRAAATDG